MNKNRLIWAIALVLLISIPIAHAQGAAGSPILIMLINAAVVFIALFILQSVLVPGKEGKEKTSMWIIILIASLLIAWFYGGSGLIWQVSPLSLLFNKYVIVNAVIIGIVIYLLSGFIDLKGKLKSPEGSIGITLIIFIVSLIIAVRIGPRWIWDASMVQSLIGFLFYVDSEGYGGILNPFSPFYKLWIFASLAVVISFFFNNFLIKGSTDKNMNIALALILSGHMAYNGISVSNVITLSEILFVLILQNSLKESIKTDWLRWVVAIGLIMWAGYAISAATGYSGVSSTVLGGGSVVGGVAFGIGWLIKALFVIAGGILAFKLLSKYLPGATP